MIILYITIFIYALYALLVGALSYGWFRLRDYKRNDVPVHTNVSVICAVRNEQDNVEKLLNSLAAQDMPDDLYEIFIVNDHSDDATRAKVEDFIKNYKGNKDIHLLNLDNSKGDGKKAALHKGIEVSKGELLVITDADCVADPRWISTTTAYYEETHPHLVLGSLYMSNSGSLFGKLQTVDFMSLIAATAGACYLEKPLMANGANIAYTREAYYSCGGFSDNIKYASGDDMFMMINVKKKYGGRAIKFLRSQHTVVTTPAEENPNLFWNQRKRWISKTKGYTDAFVLGSSLIVFFANVWIVLLAILSLFNINYLNLLLGAFAFKFIVDFPILQSFIRYMKKASLIWLVPLMEIINTVYTLVIGIAGNITKYQWKGRTHSAMD